MNTLLTPSEVDSTLRLAVAFVFVLIGVTGLLVVGGALVPSAMPSPSVTYVYDNSTVLINTTSNMSVNHWDNTTTYVTNYQNDSITVYVNTTYVVSIPVVVVTSLTVDFVNGTSETFVLPTNYSLPVGTVTWMQFEMTGTPSSLSVNSPWTLLEFSAVPVKNTAAGPMCMGHGPELVTALIGVPYTAGVDAMVVST
jgi:hypothetical protein